MSIANILGGIALISLTGAAWAAPTVYIPLGSGNQVIAVDAATRTITATYTGVENPHGLVATPDGEYLIAGSLADVPAKPGAAADAPTSKLFLIHPAHGHVMLTVPVAGWTHHQAITPDGRYVLSTHPTRGTVSALDMVGNKIVRTITVGPGPNYTLVDSAGRHAYVSVSGSGTIADIDLASWTVVRTLDAGPGPEHMVWSGDGKTLFVANPKAGTVTAVSVQSGKVTKTYTVAPSLHGLDIGDDGKTLFVSSQKDDVLVALDTESGKQTRLALAPAPYHLNTIHGAGKVYISSRKAPLIWVVDQKSLKLEGTITLPAGEGHQMAVVP